jgi:glycolate oxidase FAD binding subunit
MERPSTIEQAAAIIRGISSTGRSLQPRGGGTKTGWGGSAKAGDAAHDRVELDTRGLNRIVEHNEGDFTAIVEAGITLAGAQAAFAQCGQMLAIDPPLGAGEGATIGGIMATNDTGPARHRYGGLRDLVLGATVVLSDGIVATSGGKVIKNVAGYDLAKLFTGSFGTLGLIARVAVRLHPLSATMATAIGRTDDPDRLAGAALALARLPLEANCLDVGWANGSGRLLVRFAGDAADERAREAMARMRSLEMVETVTDDTALWAAQRAGQRATRSNEIVVKVSARQTDLANVLRTARTAGASVVSRVALGPSWLVLPSASDVDSVRSALAPRACVVLDGADRVRDSWPTVDEGVLAVMRRVKARFDPHRAFRPGAFVGGI